MDKTLPYLVYGLIGFSFYTFCVELEKLNQGMWILSLVLIIDLFCNVIFAIKGSLFRRYWMGLAGIFIGFNLIILSDAYSNVVIIIFRRVINSFFFANFGALAPTYLLQNGFQRTDMLIGVLQASFMIGFLLALLIYKILALGLSSIYLLSSVLYLGFVIRYQKLDEIQASSPIFSLSLCKRPKLLYEFIIQLCASLSFVFLFKEVRFVFSFISTQYSLFTIFLLSNFFTCLSEGILSKYFKNEGRIICFGVFITSFAYCLYSDLVIAYLFYIFNISTIPKYISVILLGAGNALMYIPTFSRLFKVANKVYSLETSQSIIREFCILSWIFINLGWVLGYYLEMYLYYNFGIYIDVIIIAIFFNGIMIFYAFLTDVFNLFSEDLTSKLNDIEIIDLSSISEEEGCK